MCLSYLGRFEEAIAQKERALQLDPFFPGTNVHYGTLLFFSRQYDRAAAQLAKTLDLYPDNPAAHEYFGDVCEKKGMLHEAITQWSAALRLTGQPEFSKILEQTFAASGFDAAIRALAEKQLQALNEKSTRGEYFPAWDYVTVYLRLNNHEQAFAWLTKAVEEPNWFALQLKVNPILDPLRSDPRFEKIIAPLGNAQHTHHRSTSS
jgi:tetratricopeptide (TPR) repeat protein